MRRVVLFLLLCGVVSWAWAQETKVVRPVRVGKSKAMREIAQNFKPGTLHKTGAGDYEVPNRPPVAQLPRDEGRIDPAWQRQSGESVAAPLVVIEGLSSDDNAAAFGFRIMPPDVNGDVGLNHVVETVNLLFRVWNKSGTPLIPATPVNELWNGFGGNCELNNDGDPVVFYDEINDRWVISQFVFSVSQCIACSETGDPLGAYNLYEFSTPGNDYPKMSNMPDAYYGTIRNFNSTFAMDAHAWNGAKIRAGDPSAEMIVRTLTGVSGIDGVMPADLDGPAAATPPGGLFLGHDDAGNRLYLYTLTPNFPAGTSTLTGPTFIPVTAYSSAFAGGFFGTSIPQPGTTQRLDVIAPFLRFSLHYRNFPTHQTMIANHVVDINDFADHAGERWYELRNTGSGWTVFQNGSYAPDANHRWMGNAAMNGGGDIGLGYSLSSSSVSPSVRYTGRVATDPSGTMTMAEGVIAAGHRLAARWPAAGVITAASPSIRPMMQLSGTSANTFRRPVRLNGTRRLALSRSRRVRRQVIRRASTAAAPPIPPAAERRLSPIRLLPPAVLAISMAVHKAIPMPLPTPQMICSIKICVAVMATTFNMTLRFLPALIV